VDMSMLLDHKNKRTINYKNKSCCRHTDSLTELLSTTLSSNMHFKLLLILLFWLFHSDAKSNSFLEIAKEMEKIDICNPSEVDKYFNTTWGAYFYESDVQCSEADLKYFERTYHEKSTSCPDAKIIQGIITYYTFLSISDLVNYTPLQQEGILLNLENIFIKIDTKDKLRRSLLFKLYTKINGLYFRNANLTKANLFLDKSLSLTKDYSPNLTINTFQLKIRNRLLTNPDENVLKDIHTYRNHYSQFIKEHGSLYYDKMTLYLIQYHTITGNEELAEKYLKELNPTYKNEEKITYLNALAKYQQTFGDNEGELDSRLKLRALAKQKRPNTIHEDYNLGKYFYRQGRYQEALEYFTSGKDQCVLKDSELQEIINLPNYISLFISISKANLKLGKVEGQKENLLEAEQYMTQLFHTLSDQRDKIHLLNNYNDLFSTIFQNKDKLDFKDEQLLKFSEQAKAYTLLNQLNEEKRLTKKLSAKEIEQYYESLKALSESKTILSQNLNLKGPEKNKILIAKNKYLERIDSLKNLAGEVNYTSFNLEKIIPKNPNLLSIEYFIHDTIGVAFIIKKDSIQTIDLGLTTGDLNNINSLKTLIGNSSSSLDQLKELSHKIFKTILGQIDLADYKDILIIPHGPISSIPFEALINDQGAYLVENHNISYAYSLSVLKEMESKGSSGSTLLGFAPRYHADPITNSLRPLFNNTSELNQINDIVPNATCLYDSLATKTQFFEQAKDFDIIHIAGHADVNIQDDDLSYIAFSDHTQNTDSTFLYLSNLYATDLNAEMIVLSACNTSLGSYKSGEGILSLARGFVHAGTASVLSTLWEVDDISTRDIMSAFYKNLAAGQNKDQALSQAKRQYLSGALEGDPESTKTKKNRHPYYWAGSVLIGDSASFAKMHSYPWHIVLTMLLAFVLGYFLFRKWKYGASYSPTSR